MSGKTAILSVRIVTDAKAGKAGLDSYASGVDQLKGKLDRAAPAAAVVGYGLFRLAGDASDAAASLEQSAGAVESVFKSQSAAIEASAEQSAKAVGVAKTDYENMAAVFGAQLKNMGVSQDLLAGQTSNLIGLGADLSAQFGGSTSDAVEAISSLLRGERDPIERYGVSIKQATINAYLAAHGLDHLSGQALTNAQTQATLAILTQQTADAHGQFARETDTASHAQQVANAQWDDAQAKLGKGLLPLIVAGSDFLATFADWVGKNSGLALTLAGVVGGLAGGLLLMNGVLRAYEGGQAAATIAQWAFNAALDANPIGLVVIAVAALIAIIVLLVQNWDTVSKVAGDVWDNIIGWIKDAIGWLQEAADWVGRLFTGQLGSSAAGAGGGGAGGGADDGFDAPEGPTGGWPSFSAPFARGSGGDAVASVTNNYWTVNGAVDKQGTARTIRNLLTGTARTNGAVTVGSRVLS
jgi:hypothetical protein